jgi:hypothetical protein
MPKNLYQTSSENSYSLVGGLLLLSGSESAGIITLLNNLKVLPAQRYP